MMKELKKQIDELRKSHDELYDLVMILIKLVDSKVKLKRKKK